MRSFGSMKCQRYIRLLEDYCYKSIDFYTARFSTFQLCCTVMLEQFRLNVQIFKIGHRHYYSQYIRSILKNASHITIDQIRQSFLKHQQSFDCVLDNFKNKYGQCQIYSLPFIGTRLDFISNRFPLFDINNTFSNVTILSFFDDVKPFESIFFERLARALPRLRTLEIINQIEQQEKSVLVMKTNTDFPHLSVRILYDIHIDYAEQRICQTNLPSLIELAIDNDILFKIIDQNQQQARDSCSRFGTILTSKKCYESIDTIRNFFLQAH
jgi:hypothetical protein